MRWKFQLSHEISSHEIIDRPAEMWTSILFPPVYKVGGLIFVIVAMIGIDSDGI